MILETRESTSPEPSNVPALVILRKTIKGEFPTPLVLKDESTSQHLSVFVRIWELSGI